MKTLLSKQFLLFIVTGGAAAAVNFGSRIIYNQWMSFSNAVIIAYITGMITAFILMKLFVFTNSRRETKHSLWIFALVNLAGIVQVWGVSVSLDYYLFPWVGMTFYPEALAHFIGIAVPVFTNYFAHKYWSFNEG
jgi:putative flippase GtrA